MEENLDLRYSALNNLLMPILLTNDGFEIIFMNNAANEYYEKSSGGSSINAVKSKCYSFLHGHDKPCFEYGEECPVKKLIDSGQSTASAYHMHTDGYYHVEASRNPDEKNLFFESLIKIKSAETGLEHAGKEIGGPFFKDFFYNNSYPMFLFNSDNMSLVDVNKAATGFYGFTRSEMLEKPIYETIAPNLKNQKGKRILYNNISHAEKKEKQFFRGIKHRLKSGEFRDIQSSLTVLRTPDGRPLILATVIDITNEVAAEAELKDSEEQYKSIAETIPEGIYIFREKIIYSNPAATDILGYTRDEFLKLAPWQLYSEEYHDISRQYQAKRISGEKSNSTITARAIAKDGRKLWLLVKGVTIKYGGKWAGFLTFTDITEKVDYEEKLLTKQRELEAQKDRVENLSRHYSALAAANEFMMEDNERNIVFNNICRIISEINRSYFVWIGLWNGIKLQPAAYASTIKNSENLFWQLKGVNPFSHEKEPLLNPATEVFKSGNRIVLNDYINSTWADESGKSMMELVMGNSAASFPLSDNGKIIGVLTIYAHKNAFPHDVASILQTIADNVSNKLYLISLENIRKENDKIIEHMAYYDSLTGVPNRANFIGRIKSANSRSRRHKIPFALLLIDLDGFKNINDTHGHETGDRLLIEATKRIKKTLRDEDELFRIGGDEFMVIVDSSKLGSQHDLVNMCERIIENINEPVCIGETTMRVGASVGVAIDFDGKSDSEEIMRIADAAMYDAKNNGKNTCIVRLNGPAINSSKNSSPIVRYENKKDPK